MMSITLRDLITEGVFSIEKELHSSLDPLQEIIEETVIYGRERHIVFLGKDRKRYVFDKRFVSLLKKKFKEADWFLSAITSLDSRLLVGVLPKDHYLLLAPIKNKGVK